MKKFDAKKAGLAHIANVGMYNVGRGLIISSVITLIAGVVLTEVNSEISATIAKIAEDLEECGDTLHNN